MAAGILYLHLGAQCPGYLYWMEQARGAANILGLGFESRDVDSEPDLAREHRMFFPGKIVAGPDFRPLAYGTSEQIAESYRRGGSIPGDMVYRQPPQGKLDRVAPASPALAREMAAVCVRAAEEDALNAKRDWLARRGGDIPGYVGYVGGDLVAAMELVPEESIAYPIPSRMPLGVFITCLYGVSGEVDYRMDLVTRAAADLAARGAERISAVSGRDTPYPNGPLALFSECGFAPGPYLGRALLRHRWEDTCFVTHRLR